MATTDVQTSPRQDRRKARTRARILDAAEGVFSDDADAATVERIADAADVAVATIYQHFGGKDELHMAVVERAIERNEHHMLAVYESAAEPVEKLIDAAGAYLRFHLASPQMFRMIALQQGRPTGEVANGPTATMVTTRVNRMTSALSGVIDAGVAGGAFRGVSSLATARFLWGSMNGVIALSTRPDPLRLTAPELRDALIEGIELILEGLVTDALRDPDGRLARNLRERLHSAIGNAEPEPDSQQA
jgi:AcrR family transcriptional regulator